MDMDQSAADSSPPTRNIKLVLAYRGTAYHGWQRQDGEYPTVQGCVESAAGRLLGHPVTVHGTSRTDAGVHAAGQVANLHTTNRSIPLTNFRRALNSKLPPDIAAISAREAPADFHASRCAVAKTYRYRIYTRPVKPVMFADEVWHYWLPLDVEAMGRSADRLVGRHDFRGFAFAAEQRQNTVRTIYCCRVEEGQDEINMCVTGDGFLYKMVRNIVGTLVEIGRGRWREDRIDRILLSRDRQYAGPTAPACGLCLMSVEFPPEDEPGLGAKPPAD